MRGRSRLILALIVAAVLVAGLGLLWAGRREDGLPPSAPGTAPPPRADGTIAPPWPGADPTGASGLGPSPSTSASPAAGKDCRVDTKLVPACNVLWGAAPGAFTEERGAQALAEYEQKTGRTQTVYHAYHRGMNGLFPTDEEIAIAGDPARPRVLFLNWKPWDASWAEIAAGGADDYLDELADHIRGTYTAPFFFTVHHEPEEEVRERPGSGYTAHDYRAMFRHVVSRLRGHGVDNLVTVVVHMAYVPYTSEPWFQELYPGDDVVDWVAWDTYAYSDRGEYGHGDFAELMNRTSSEAPDWPGFYNWAAARHPSKPLMVAEWGVWASHANPGHQADFYRSVARQLPDFPRIKALVHFDTPHDQRGRDSRPERTSDGLAAYRELGGLPMFQVDVR
ncbi:glycosyl hydrolase [Catenuloplanes japonicus]|uniref:glycosyl hydrolase n=1 Tax=Catenuloplanes japonicus TaxID=33876 RepID=UPI00068EC37D|nr:glycosyl hydrolase [Catenuloplanes japonicus]